MSALPPRADMLQRSRMSAKCQKQTSLRSISVSLSHRPPSTPTRGCSACRMEETADRDVFTEHVEALHRLLSLQDFDLDVVLGQNL